MGAGAFVSGALGAALLAAAALLFAPGEARAAGECGSAITLPITCTGTSYPDGIFYGGSDDNNHPRGNGPINVAGSSTGPTTITATDTGMTTQQSVGIYVYGLGGSRVWNDLNVGVTVDSMGEMTDAGHVVDIVQGTSTNNAADRNNGIYFQHRSQMGDSTVRVGRGVTIGSETTPMQQNGIFYHPRGLSSWGGGKATLISAATIFAAKQGIRLFRNPSNVYHPTFRRTSHTTITNRGAIRSGEEGIYLYFARPAGGATHLGDATITNTGAITVSGARYGIFMDYRGYGATEIDNAGTIAAAAGSGIHLAHNNNGTVTLTNSGGVNVATVGLRIEKRSGTGAVAFTNSGRVTVTADAAAGAGHALWLWEAAGVTGGVTITNNGVLSSKNHALFAETSAANAAVLTLTNEAAIASADGDGIRLARGVEGDVTVTNSADVSGRWHGVYVGRAARIDFDQTGGTISGRTGVYAEVSSASASGDTRSTDSDGNHDPAIDVAWTGGNVARGTAANDQGRFRAASAAQALSFDQESAAVKAVAGSVRWGAAAGIEAHALSWRDVAEVVAEGDDPGAFADNAAQLAAVPTGATASGNAYVAQLRAALGNADLAVAAAVWTAIDSTATSLSDVTDAEIVTYLQTGDAATRTLLQNILAQGLSDDEKAILRAVAAGDDAGVDAALTAAGFSDDTSDPADYWSLVKALLGRYHIDDVRIAMTAGSIDSRGDGIRAYYATPHDSNGGISVTIGEGVSVTGGQAGVYVANAGTGLQVARKYTYGFGMNDGATADDLVAVTYGEGAGAVALRNQLVTVAGTVTGGTDAAVRLSGGGAVIVTEGGEAHAGASGVGILADGPALVYVDGEVRGGEGGAAAVHLEGGGTVTVGLNGRVRANGAANAIQSDGAGTTDRLTLITESSRLTDMVPYRDDLISQVEGSLSGIDSARLREYANGVPTGYSLTLGITGDGMLDTSKFPSRPTSYDCAAADGRCVITEAGTVSDRRTGVYAAVPRTGATAASQPLIDVTWTGTFSQGAASDAGRFAAETARDALTFDRESAAVEVVEATTRWGAPAGIEAHALSWRDVAAQAAKGDDPGEIADNTAQLAAVPTGATASDNAYVAAFRAALENGDLTVAPAVLTAIGTTATTAATDLTDAQIVTYLQTDDAPTRALLRNVLAQGLSDKEKAVLAAVAVGDAAALTTALNDADAGFPSDYKAAVQALLGRHNVGDVRIAMNEGSIDSRGDGIRAYYATPHDLNGGIEVTVGAGASVTAGLAGVYVANAGGDVTVTSGGTIDAGAYGIRVVKPGSSGDVTITTTGGSITADLHGVYPQDNAGHTGAVTVTNGGDVTAGLAGVYVNRLGSGAVTVTNTGGTVRGETEPGLFAANKAGDASDVTVNVTGGEVRSTGLNSTVRSTGWNSTAVHAWNRGAGDVTVTLGAEARAVSKHAAGVLATLGADADNNAGRIAIAQGGTVMGRTGVYALAAHGTTAETVTPRAAADQPLIDVTWTGTFSHGTEADVSPDDLGRFEAATAAEMLVFDRETAAGKETVRWGAPAGIEAQAMSWRAVAAEVAKGDDPVTIADRTARERVFDTRPTADADLRAKSSALVKQVKAMLDNDEIVVEAGSALAAFIDAMDTTDDDVYTEEEIAAYLATDDDNIREGLQAVMALGLSEGEKAVLAAVAAGDDAGLDAALTAAGFTDDDEDAEDYWSRVKALLERYNVGDVRVAMNGGSIDSRGDGIRAWYATPHADNGGIRVTVAEGASVAGALAGVYVANAGGDVTVSNRGTVRGGTYGVYAANAAANGAIEVTVAAGASVTGGTAGVYAANAGPGLTLERKYTPGFAEGEDPDELVAVVHGEGEGAAPLRNQLVTVAGTVTGGTDAAVHLSGGGAVLVMEGGRVHAGASGVGILVNDPGPALVYVDGEVKGGAGGAAAVHLTGGGSVVVGLNGRVQANGADHAIRGGGDVAAMVALTLVTDGMIEYREDAEAAYARVEGSIEDVAAIRFREDRNGVPTGYSTSLTVPSNGMLDTRKLPSRPEPPTEPPLSCPERADGRCVIAPAGTITGRTGVYAAVEDEGATVASQPLIDVTWTGTFSHAEGDRGRFAAETIADVLAFDQESAAGKAVEETVRWDAAAGIEAHVLSWRDVAAQVAKGDDPGAIADAAAQTALLATSGAASRRAAILAQFRAALKNEDVAAADAVLTAIDSTAASVDDLSDEEIETYLSTDDGVTRALLRNVLAQGLSDAEKAVLRAVATNTGVDAALDDADAGFTAAWKTAVRALLERYNVGDVNIEMTAGSIDSRGDGIRAYYATPHDMNGGISVTVAEGARVTGATAGVYVANAGEGLRLARKYTPGYAADDNPDEVVAVMHGEGAEAAPLRNQLVTVAGTVIGGTDAAVHLSGGGAVLVMEGGRVHAGASGVGILVNDPGPAVVYVDGEIKGGAGGVAAVHLTGGGNVIVGLNGRVQANGADRAIRGGATDETMVALIVVTDDVVTHREDAAAANARVEGSLEDVDEVRFREDRDGVPTGYSRTLPVGDDGRLDTRGLPLRPCPEGQTRGDDGVCAPTPSGPAGPGTDTDVDGVRVTIPGEGSTVSRDDGIRAEYETPHDDNDAIRVIVARNASVTGSMAGVYVANAGLGLRLARKYTPGYSKEDENRANELVAVTHGEGADAVPLRNQLVTVHGTVTGGTDAAVHLSGGGAVLVMEGGRVHAGASGVGILVNDPGPALAYVDGEVKGGAGGRAAVHLTGGGSVIVGLHGKVQANGADHAIRGGGDETTKVALILVTDRMIPYREDANKAYEQRVEGSLEDVDEVRFREDKNGVPTGYSRTLPVTDRGRLDTRGLRSSTFSCEEAGDRRCGLYEALPSMLLEMNGLPSWAERTSAARDANGGWARVESARGEWQAKKAAMGGELAYDHRRSGVRAGFDFLAGENARVGVSAHALGGKAQMSGVGEVELDGMGGGLSVTWLAGDLYVDAQAGLTLYDVGVESYTHGELLKKDVDGAGYALGVEMGARMPVGRALVTPRGGLSWSKADLDDFTDLEAAGGPRAPVSVEGARSVKARLGVMVETELGMGGSSGRLFGSLDVERELSDETEVEVGGQALETEVRPASVRLGAGGVFEVDENVVLRATAGYRTSGRGTSGYGGGLELHVRF